MFQIFPSCRGGRKVVKGGYTVLPITGGLPLPGLQNPRAAVRTGKWVVGQVNGLLSKEGFVVQSKTIGPLRLASRTAW